MPHATPRRLTVLRLVLPLLAAATIAGCPATPAIDGEQQLDAYAAEPYARVLDAAVRDGLVDYSAIAGPVERDLNRYLDALARFGPSGTPEQFPTRAHELAYYLNAYNAFMLRKWLDEGAADAPPDVKVNWITWFTVTQWRLDGRAISMDALKQRIILDDFNEPRVHFALVNGSRSAPPLLGEPFAAANLDEQLDTLGRRWFAEDDALRMDQTGQTYLAAVFRRHQDDFAPLGGLPGVIEQYLPSEDERKVPALMDLRRGTMRYMSDDWTINQAPPRDGSE
jgi:hypothetical protein